MQLNNQIPKFDTKKIPSVNGKQQVNELVIDGVGQWDRYEKSVEEKYETDIRSILTLMELVANNKSLPKQKFRDITPKKERVKEYEFKKGDLRVYAIDMKNGKIIVLGGFKNQQKNDIKKFRSLKESYLISLNSQPDGKK